MDSKDACVSFSCLNNDCLKPVFSLLLFLVSSFFARFDIYCHRIYDKEQPASETWSHYNSALAQGDSSCIPCIYIMSFVSKGGREGEIKRITIYLLINYLCLWNSKGRRASRLLFFSVSAFFLSLESISFLVLEMTQIRTEDGCVFIFFRKLPNDHAPGKWRKTDFQW